MASDNTGEVLERLSGLERNMNDLLTLVRQIDTRLAGDESGDTTIEGEFYNAEGGE